MAKPFRNPGWPTKAAIIMEAPDGTRMVYRLIPESLDLEPEEYPSIWYDTRVMDEARTRITLEGILVDGMMWTGDMPGQDPPQLGVEKKGITDGN